jgi:hypothetical protein
MDPENPVVKLCMEGMEAEARGKMSDARALFQRAWSASQDDYEACVAAHFLARHQESPRATFDWNREALRRAEAVGDDRARSFYSSLHLNLAHSYETLGDKTEANAHYRMAAGKLSDVPEGPYKDVVRDGIERGVKRLEGVNDGRDDQRFVWRR